MTWKEWIVVGIILIIIGSIKEFYPIPTYITTIIGIGIILFGYLSKRCRSKRPGYAAEILWSHCGNTSSIIVRGESYNKFKRNLDKIMVPRKCGVCGNNIEPEINPVMKIGRLEKL